MKHHLTKPYLDPRFRDVFDGHCVVDLSEDERPTVTTGTDRMRYDEHAPTVRVFYRAPRPSWLVRLWRWVRGR